MDQYRNELEIEVNVKIYEKLNFITKKLYYKQYFFFFSSSFRLNFLGECRALSHLGAVHMALQNYTHAIKCYQEQLERAQDLQDSAIEAEAFGNLGIAKLNR